MTIVFTIALTIEFSRLTSFLSFHGSSSVTLTDSLNIYFCCCLWCVTIIMFVHNRTYETMRRRLIMKQKLLDELGAPVDDNLLCATVSKQWMLHCFFLRPVRPPAGFISLSQSVIAL